MLTGSICANIGHSATPVVVLHPNGKMELSVRPRHPMWLWDLNVQKTRRDLCLVSGSIPGLQPVLLNRLTVGKALSLTSHHNLHARTYIVILNRAIYTEVQISNSFPSYKYIFYLSTASMPSASFLHLHRMPRMPAFELSNCKGSSRSTLGLEHLDAQRVETWKIPAKSAGQMRDVHPSCPNIQVMRLNSSWFGVGMQYIAVDAKATEFGW